MDGRQARGRILAQAHGDRIRPIEGDLWFVPSDKAGGYVVDIAAGRCGCPDSSQNEVRCKHLIAVELVRGAMVKAEDAPVAAPVPPTVPAPARAPAKVPPRGDLTVEEQKHVREAMKFLRTRHGWEALAKGLRFTARSLEKVAYGQMVTASVAVRLARYAGVPVDDVLTGKFPPLCPHCGQRMPATAAP